MVTNPEAWWVTKSCYSFTYYSSCLVRSWIRSDVVRGRQTSHHVLNPQHPSAPSREGPRLAVVQKDMGAEPADESNQLLVRFFFWCLLCFCCFRFLLWLCCFWYFLVSGASGAAQSRERDRFFQAQDLELSCQERQATTLQVGTSGLGFMLLWVEGEEVLFFVLEVSLHALQVSL